MRETKPARDMSPVANVTTRVSALSVILALILSGIVLTEARRAAASGEFYVAPYGDDTNPGSVEAPWQTVRKGLTSIAAGDTLFLRAGTYVERIKNPPLASGTSSAPIVVKAYEGERPVVQGLLWVKGASYWRFDGISVTWDEPTGRPWEPLVMFTRGTGWTFTNAEVWGARSAAAIRVAGAARRWTLSWLYVHDTYKARGASRGDLISVVARGGGGVIERNLLTNSENGRAVRVGPTWRRGAATASVEIRYNTMYNNRGPSNVQFKYRARKNLVHRNIMVATKDSSKANVTPRKLRGRSNVVARNLGWASGKVKGPSPLVDGGGNRLLDPQFADPEGGDFHPLNPDAENYGVYAPEIREPYRAFKDTSYWNTRLPANAPIDPKSRDFVRYMQKNPVGDFVMFSGADRDGRWGTPIYWADPTDPVYDVRSDRYGVPPEFKSLRIPRGARPDDTPDAEMMIYDLDKGYVAAFWLARYDPLKDTWVVGGGDIWYLGSNGIEGILRQSDDRRNRGHRGAAAPIFAIRWDEIQAGVINHVLKVAIPNPRSTHVFPMSNSDGKTNDPNAPPEGARFRLKRSINLDALNLTRAQYAVAKAAQDYGFVVTDRSGAPVAVGLENVVAERRGWLWEGVLAWDSLRMFSLSDYEFVRLGYGA